MLNSTYSSFPDTSGWEPSVRTAGSRFLDIMPVKPGRRTPLAFLFVAALLFASLVGCDDDDEVIVGPGVFPDVRGAWSGQYRVTGCSLSGAADPFFCSELFASDESLILDLDLDQSGADVFGVIAQGELIGDVDGTIDELGVVRLFGDVGEAGDPVFTSILAWQTGLVGDSLVGSWRFSAVDQTGSGFGRATVDATLKLFGPTVLKFFGCAAQRSLTADGLVSGSLNPGDCQIAASLFVEGLADGAFFDVYTITGSAGDSIDVVLRSTDFDAFLLVSDLEEGVLGGDDDSGGGPDGTDAAVTIIFDTAETLMLIATSFSPGEAGPYSLSATNLGPTSPLAGAAPGVVRVIGRLENSGKATPAPASTVDPIRELLKQKLSRPTAWPRR